MVTKKSEIMCEVIEKRQQRAFWGDESLGWWLHEYTQISKFIEPST